MLTTALIPDHIWHSYDISDFNNRLIFEKETAVFSLYNINPERLDDIYQDLNEYLEPFRRIYPWFHSPPIFDKFQYKDFKYIYGKLVYQDNINDEWLITALLWDFLKRHPDSYIHVWDSSDFEYLLVECSEIIPENLEPVNSLNMPWINCGALVLVINETERSLTMEEALDNITIGEFQISRAITERLEEKFSRIRSTYFLEFIHDVKVQIPWDVAQALTSQPFLISRSINEIVKEEELEVENKTFRVDNLDLQSRTLAIPSLTLNFAKFKYSNLRKRGFQPQFEEFLLRALIIGLRNITEKLGSFHHRAMSSEGFEGTFSRGFLQSVLIEKGLIKGTVAEETPDFEAKGNLSNTEEIDENVLMEGLNKFFNDADTNWEGIENFGNGEDRETRGEKSNSDPDIDLDDFFEFFLKDALKLSDEEIQSYANPELMNNKGKPESGRGKRRSTSFEYNNDSDYHSDTATEYFVTNDTSESDSDDNA